MRKKILLIVLGAFVLIQFFRPDRSVNKSSQIALNQIFSDKEALNLFQGACKDCHSNETSYPWYSEVAPVSWIIQHHINEGREHANFSLWNTYNKDQKRKILEEAVEEIERDKMPMGGYRLLHSEANLTARAKEKLIAAFKEIAKREQLRTEEEYAWK